MSFGFIPLEVNSKKFEELSLLVEKTCPNECIISIEKIVNDELEERYQKYKSECKHEITLFHGTSSEIIKEICKNGFKKEFNKVAAYGKGTYFATAYSYSKSYSKLNNNYLYKSLFICKIAYNKLCLGSPNRKCPNGYDVQVDNVKSPNIYSVDKDEAILPEYLVRFYN